MSSTQEQEQELYINQGIAQTLKYYNQNANSFCANTQNADMSAHYARFLHRLRLNTAVTPYNDQNTKEAALTPSARSIPSLSSPSTKAPLPSCSSKTFPTTKQTQDTPLHILDFGCGSGRDTLYFLQQGFCVTAIDGSSELASAASRLTGISVICVDFRDYEPLPKSFNGIWACASLLHLALPDLVSVLQKLLLALTDNGILYMSFKYGHGTSLRNGRLFTDMNEESMGELLALLPQSRLLEQWITSDVRQDHPHEKWLNIIIGINQDTLLSAGSISTDSISIDSISCSPISTSSGSSNYLEVKANGSVPRSIHKSLTIHETGAIQETVQLSGSKSIHGITSIQGSPANESSQGTTKSQEARGSYSTTKSASSAVSASASATATASLPPQSPNSPKLKPKQEPELATGHEDKIHGHKDNIQERKQ